MDEVTSDKFSGVSRLPLESTYYVKAFTGHGEFLKKMFGAGRYQRELKNLRYFNQIGLNTPSLAAYGEVRFLGLLRQAMLVTAEVEDALSLEQLIEGGDLYRHSVVHVRKILKELASAIRKLHGDGFYHRDLKPRNILVQASPLAGGKLYFFDCPSGYRPLGILRERNFIRDLAYLERGMHGHFRKVDLLYCFKEYRGVKKLSERDKAFLREVLTYYKTRKLTKKRAERAARRATG